jgi:hypothetical protein
VPEVPLGAAQDVQVGQVPRFDTDGFGVAIKAPVGFELGDHVEGEPVFDGLDPVKPLEPAAPKTKPVVVPDI